MVSRRNVLVALLVGAGLSLTLGAQSAKPCMIMGFVRDAAASSPLAGVSIEVTSDSGAKPLVVSTDGEGKFQLSDLPSATYTLTATMPDYTTFKEEGIYLAPGVNRSMAVNLRPSRR